MLASETSEKHRLMSWCRARPGVAARKYILGQPAATRVPVGHPEGYLEAFATIYDGFVHAVRAHLDGQPLAPANYAFPTVHDGLRGMEFIHAAVESANRNAAWTDLPPTPASAS